MPRAISLPPFPYHFICNWRLLLLTFATVTLFVRLGFWQLQRAEVKKVALRQNAQALSRPPIPLEGQTPRQYQQVQLRGHYLAPVFLLDNQHYQHQFGYNVLSPLQLADGSVVLIDRGWIMGDVKRQAFPKVVSPKGEIHLSGSVYYPSKNPWVLGPAFEKKANNTTIIEGFDVQWLIQILQKKVHSFIIRLDKKAPHGFQREWAIVAMPPERHFGYALQWFAFALAVFILFIVWHVKKNEDNS
jgi:surfeit locus 1 family protein